MQEPNVKRVGNMFVYEESFTTDMFEWGVMHPDMDFVIDDDCSSDASVTIYAYAPIKHTIELQNFVRSNTGLKVHGNIPAGLLGRLGYVR